MTWKDDVRVNQGGLMRCCLQSIGEIFDALKEEPEDGTKFDCKYEQPGNESITYEHRRFRWSGMQGGELVST